MPKIHYFKIWSNGFWACFFIVYEKNMLYKFQLDFNFLILTIGIFIL